MNKICSILLLLPFISAFAPSGVAHNRNPSSALFSVADLKAAFELSPKTFLLDVREPNEWAEGHLALASPNPLSVLTSGTWMDRATGKFSPGSFPIDRATGVAIMPNKKVYIHCKMGGRAKQAGELLTQMGYQDVVVLEETFDELVAAEICDVVIGEVQDLTD
uniref:Rhodanese domain-containing protein n=1 Tax=Eucampia antarctica TaxID=49252 RepID=A0A7S2R043_9STRA|mmetsp:Transcript_10942/g.10458  ORF Transcript_10942/g.10458 Transcript_10942/m.10458 type:complete len:163 (+) Transcript_10942:110-598(+)|eukprot:CAMPEP_0197826654 /NCGR_PEP_ID=MMETSP1437-20131217/3585_1 /TAXON_ID=49252 ORGANISM="Eucampia antarctica, Strain CCMP1452" /NCGR_SAMPLE_ID=MMETSP1437 /ASSEMBLY_ACC=CAM_ASM_001096 /LENGTH=162 /DNA_ID=CAMNT_0043427179 /DNA_START=98 /DNA_END=586 /DNA_ORIENTATION=+